MKNFQLTIELLPKGAWGNDLSKTLSKKNWDILRNNCYKRANHRCAICGYQTNELDAHEVWEFDLKNETQTLKNIIGICTRCHGVKHFKNSVRMGYDEIAKEHFMKVNECTEKDFANHLLQALINFDENNNVLRWKMNANLGRFGGENIAIKQINVPIIKSPYEKLEWQKLTYGAIKKHFTINKTENNFVGVPKVTSIIVDNFQGTITLMTMDMNRIEWFLDDKIVKTKFNIAGPFKSNFSVKGLEGKFLHFKITNGNGSITSKKFELVK